jgi:competence protein ComEC
MDKENKIRIFIFAVIFLVFVNILVWSAPQKTSSGFLTVHFLDVGQGDAIFIDAPNGRQMLIDGGRNAGVVRELSRFMNFNDREIDVLLATHPDSDHIGGFPEVFNRFRVLNFVDNGKETDSYAHREIMNSIFGGGTRYLTAERGLVIVLDKKSGVYFQTLAPANKFNFASDNEMSVFGRLVYGDVSFLLTGDAGKMVENILVYHDGELLKSNVLKVGHHGSKSSSGMLFLEKVEAEFAIISASAGNSYGHPDGGVVKNLENSGAAILETSKEGSIVFQTDGVNLWRK